MLSSPFTPGWVFDSQEFHAILSRFIWPSEIKETLIREVESISRDPLKVEAFIEFAGAWEKESATMLPESGRSTWNALVVLAFFPKLYQLHQKRNIPWEVTCDTMNDLPRRMLNYKEVFGEWGFNAQRWMWNHVHGKVYEVGRLQYNAPALLRYPAEVYAVGEKNRVLARSGLFVDSEGWIISGSETDKESGWRTRLEIGEHHIIGNPVDSWGRILKQKVEIPVHSRSLLNETSEVLNIHIPMGEKLNRENALDSLERARKFFTTHFSEYHLTAFCCGSWLLDRAFQEILSETSNIVQFGRLFQALPHPDPVDRTHYRWIYGEGFSSQNLPEVPRQTSLQKSVYGYLQQGGKLHNTAGFILF